MLVPLDFGACGKSLLTSRSATVFQATVAIGVQLGKLAAQEGSTSALAAAHSTVVVEVVVAGGRFHQVVGVGYVALVIFAVSIHIEHQHSVSPLVVSTVVVQVDNVAVISARKSQTPGSAAPARADILVREVSVVVTTPGIGVPGCGPRARLPGTRTDATGSGKRKARADDSIDIDVRIVTHIEIPPSVYLKRVRCGALVF